MDVEPNNRKRSYAVTTGFPAARRAVVRSFINASQMADGSGIARDTCYALFNEAILDSHFTPALQHKVLLLAGNEGVLFEQFRRTLEIREEEYTKLTKYAGRYIYHRYNLQGTRVSGAMVIEKRSGAWMAKHYNQAFNQHGFKAERPDHEGFVFILADRLQILALGGRYFRSMIANTVKSVTDDYVRGVLMSVNQNGGLFAASFVMVHETHEEFANPNLDHYFKLIEASNRLSGVLAPNSEP